MNRYILLCKCSNVPQSAKLAFEIAFPGQEEPPVYRGADAIRALTEQKPNTNFSKYVSAIAKKHGRFAYYIEEEDGNIMQSYDLLKGRRVA